MLCPSDEERSLKPRFEKYEKKSGSLDTDGLWYGEGEMQEEEDSEDEEEEEEEKEELGLQHEEQEESEVIFFLVLTDVSLF